ncbi:hypothetical protein Tco_1393775 [Tanacetum coccineum]
MVKPEKPLKKKDQITLDEELALRLHAKEQAELEKERADKQLATRLQAKEQGQFSIEEKSRMLVEMILERKKFFATQRAAEQRSKPPTKTQISNRMCTYLKNMGGYKHNSEVVKSSETRTEGNSKRVGYELESDKSKKQKIDEHVEAEKMMIKRRQR